MRNTCCVPNCKSRRSSIKLHRFPSTETGLKWVESINCDKLKQLSSKELLRLYVCNKHFEKRDVTSSLRLHRSAYPTLFTDEEIETGIQKDSAQQNVLHDNNYLQSRQRKHEDHTYSAVQKNLRDNQQPQDLKSDGRKVSNTQEPSNPDKSGEKTASTQEPLQQHTLSLQQSSLSLEQTTMSLHEMIEKSKLESTTDKMVVYSDDYEDFTESENTFHLVQTDGPFSWQKKETSIQYIDDDAAQVAPAAAKDTFEFLCGDVYADSLDYRCNLCDELITGARYTCLQCADFELCGHCEAADKHAAHYVLRTPANAPQSEVTAVLTAARAALASNQVLLGEDIEIKSELGEEGDDPIPSRPASQATSDYSARPSEALNSEAEEEGNSPMPSRPASQATSDCSARPRGAHHESVDEESDSDRYSPGSDSGDSDDTEYSHDTEYKRKRKLKNKSPHKSKKVVTLTLENNNEEMVLSSALAPVATKTSPIRSSTRSIHLSQNTDTAAIKNTVMENFSNTQISRRQNVYIVYKQPNTSLSTESGIVPHKKIDISGHKFKRPLILQKAINKDKVVVPINITPGNIVSNSNVLSQNQNIQVAPRRYTVWRPKREKTE